MKEENEKNQPSLTLTDLSNILSILDFAAQQGAFKGWDVINKVLLIRNKLAFFLEANAPKEENTKEENTKEENTKEENTKEENKKTKRVKK